MGDPSAFGFGQFVPGFDFLQNLSKTAASGAPGVGSAAMPGMSSWVAPTLSIEDIDKRIQELKSVLFWLEQNTTALKATIQAMEVQKMTLTTLQSMNVNMADLAKAFTAKPPVAEPAPAPASPAANKSSLFTPQPAPSQEDQAEPEPQVEPTPAAGATRHASAEPSAAAQPIKPAVDPMQWWGALTQQFQGIAAAAMKDVAGSATQARTTAKAVKTAKTPAVRQAAAKRPAAPTSNPSTTRKSAAPRRAQAAAKSRAAKPSRARAVPAKAAVRKTNAK
jgi:hypothetical protein